MSFKGIDGIGQRLRQWNKRQRDNAIKYRDHRAAAPYGDEWDRDVRVMLLDDLTYNQIQEKEKQAIAEFRTRYNDGGIHRHNANRPVQTFTHAELDAALQKRLTETFRLVPEEHPEEWFDPDEEDADES